VVWNSKKSLTAWFSWFAKQFHARLFRSPTSFLVIADYTGANQVLPAMLSTEVPWDNVVQSKLASLLTAVLAGELVAVKDLETGKLWIHPRTFHHISKANN